MASVVKKAASLLLGAVLIHYADASTPPAKGLESSSGTAASTTVDSAANGACDSNSTALPRVAFLILVHDTATLRACERLMDALYDPVHHFYVHFDAKMEPSTWDYEWRRISHGRSTNMAAFSYHNLKWGSWSMLSPWFSAATMALEPGVEWDYMINLSADSYPVLRPRALREALAKLQSYNFMTSSKSVTGMKPTAWSEFDTTWHKRRAFRNPIIEGFNAEPHYGSQWMILTRDFVSHVDQELKREGSFTANLAEWFEHGSIEVDTGRGVRRVRPHIPDEIFFPTVIAASPFNNTIPPPRLGGLYSTHYIRMDEHYPWTNFQQRYSQPAFIEKATRAWGPYYLGVYDLEAIKTSGALFIRKVSDQVESSIMEVLPVESHYDIPLIGWPKGRHTSPVTITQRSEETELDANGCVRVAESIHCAPRHNLDPEYIATYDLPVEGGG